MKTRQWGKPSLLPNGERGLCSRR